MSNRHKFRGKTTGGSPPPPVVEQAATLLGPKSFVLGTWVPHASEIATWKSRGVDVMVGLDRSFQDGPGSGTNWYNSVVAAGAKMIIRRDNEGLDYLASDMNDPNVLAHMLYDEPEGGGHKTPGELAAEIASIRAAGSTKPTFVNYLGNSMAFQYGMAPYTNTSGVTPYTNLDYLNVAGLDWFSSDIYPPMFGAMYVYGWSTALEVRDSFTTTPGAATRNMHFGPFNQAVPGSAGKATFGFVATGRISGPTSTARSLTAAEFRCLTWSIIINGASGILFFPQYFPDGGAQINDDTNSVILTAIADLVSKINLLQNQGGVNLLMNTTSGGRRTFTPRRCADTYNGDPANPPNFKPPVGNQLPPPFEGMEISAGGETYRIVLNLFPSNQTLTDAAWGFTNDPFTAHQVKCWRVSSGVDLFASGTPDTTPNPFDFGQKSNVARSATIESDPIVLSGIDAAASILAPSTGTYSLNGGAVTGLAGTYNPGDTLRRQLVSSSAYFTNVLGGLTVGGITGQFQVTTAPDPTGAPQRVSPAPGYDGTVTSMVTAPADTTRVKAKPMIQWWDYDKRTFTGDYVIGVYADSKGGLSGVTFHVHGTNYTVVTPTLYVDTDSRGNYRARWGYWITLRASDFLAASADPVCRIYATATPTDPTYQARTIGYAADNTVKELYPATSINDGTFRVRLDGAGGLYTSVKLAMAAAAAAGKKRPLIQIEQNGFYEAENKTWTAVTDGKGYCDIRCIAGITATIGRVTMPTSAARSAWTWDIGWAWVRFGPGITLDDRNWHTLNIYNSSAAPCIDGGTLTNSIGTRDTLYYFKGPHPGLTAIDAGGTNQAWRFIDCDRYYQGSGNYSYTFEGVQSLKEIDGVRTGIKFVARTYEREVDCHFYIAATTAFTVTGPAGATLGKPNGVGPGFPLVLKNPAGTVLASYTLSSDPLSAYYNTDAIADHINANFGGLGYSATKVNNSRNSTAIFQNGTTLVLSATPSAVTTSFDIHSEYIQVADWMVQHKKENIIFADVHIHDGFFSTGPTNIGDSFDVLLANCLFGDRLSQNYASPGGGYSHFLMKNVTIGGMLIYNSQRVNETEINQCLIGYLYSDAAASTNQWYSGMKFINCVIGVMAQSGPLAGIMPNGTGSVGNVLLGGDASSIWTYFVDPANNNYLPSATALGNQKPAILTYDGIWQPRAANDAITPWGKNSSLRTWRV